MVFNYLVTPREKRPRQDTKKGLIGGISASVWVDDMFDEKVREDEERKTEQEKSSVSFE